MCHIEVGVSQAYQFHWSHGLSSKDSHNHFGIISNFRINLKLIKKFFINHFDCLNIKSNRLKQFEINSNFFFTKLIFAHPNKKDIL